MNLVENVYEISESFMKEPKWVHLNKEKIEQIAEEMKATPPPTFPVRSVKNIYKGVLLELVGSSINYCYWYGKSSVRPNGTSSTFMGENLANAFFDYEEKNDFLYQRSLSRFIELLIINRFPLIEERITHLNQLREYGEHFVTYLLESKSKDSINDLMEELIIKFPGFASDIFLKRASLFFIQLFRRFGWFKEELYDLHVPADYQVPKMLNYYDCISYNPQLLSAIQQDILIPKNSDIECEIRSATILTIRDICKLTGWNVAEVDGYFFLRRNDNKNKFHITITTDY